MLSCNNWLLKGKFQGVACVFCKFPYNATLQRSEEIAISFVTPCAATPHGTSMLINYVNDVNVNDAAVVVSPKLDVVTDLFETRGHKVNTTWISNISFW